jgi:hypothetical protein
VKFYEIKEIFLSYPQSFLPILRMLYLWEGALMTFTTLELSITQIIQDHSILRYGLSTPD